jgi:hypothetical protein
VIDRLVVDAEMAVDGEVLRAAISSQLSSLLAEPDAVLPAVGRSVAQVRAVDGQRAESETGLGSVVARATFDAIRGANGGVR